MRGPLPFLRSVAHSRPAQLAHRLRRIARRRVLERLGPLLPVARAEASWGQLALAEHLPQPLFPRRRDQLAVSGGRRLLLLAGRAKPLELPLDWHARDWKRGTRLALIELHSMKWIEALGDEELARVVCDWIAASPRYTRAYWLDSWNSFALSIRCVVWMQQLAVRWHRLDRAFLDRVLRSLIGQLRFLERNLELDLGGNHLVKNVLALLWAGAFFRGPEAERWSALGQRLLARELPEQVLPDGMHFERSPAYHAQVLADLLECAAVLPEGPLLARLRAALPAMAQVLADLTHPDGGVSLFNDGGLTMARPTGEVLAVAARASGRRVEPRRHFALPHAGYYGVRGRGALLVVQCGPIAPDHLPAHGHGGLLAFEWSHGGRRVVVDAGVLEYDEGPWRAWSRSTVAHNTVTLDNLDQCEFHGSFRVGRRAAAHLERFEVAGPSAVVEGHHDAYRHLRGRPRHVRRIAVAPGSLRVEDFVEGGAGQHVCARLLLHPEARIERDPLGLRIHLRGERLELDCEHPVRVVDAWWCPDFGERRRTRQLVLTYGQAPCSGTFALRAVPAGVPALRPGGLPLRTPA